MAEEHKCQATEQIDKLANFLMKEFQDEFGKAGSEGAVEMAIRLLGQYPKLVSMVEGVIKQHEDIKKAMDEIRRQ